MLAGEARRIASDRAGFLGSHPEATRATPALKLNNNKGLIVSRGGFRLGSAGSAGIQESESSVQMPEYSAGQRAKEPGPDAHAHFVACFLELRFGRIMMCLSPDRLTSKSPVLSAKALSLVCP